MQIIDGAEGMGSGNRMEENRRGWAVTVMGEPDRSGKAPFITGNVQLGRFFVVRESRGERDREMV